MSNTGKDLDVAKRPARQNSKAFGPKNLLSLQSQIDSKESERLRKRNSTLKSRPKKEDTVIQFHNLVSAYSRYLINSGLDSKTIYQWISEPWNYHSIRKCIEWFHETMVPQCQNLDLILSKYTVEGWKHLAATNSRHSDFAAIRKQQQVIRNTWYARPRFKLERGRVEKEGY